MNREDNNLLKRTVIRQLANLIPLAPQGGFFRRMSIIMVLGFFLPAAATAGDFRIRIGAGLGHTRTDFSPPGIDKDNHHYTLQFLSYIPGDRLERAWGFEVGRHIAFTSDVGDQKYTSVGILVESRLYRNLKGQLGTMGYLRDEGSNTDPFGFRASIGWEHPLSRQFSIAGFLRQDFIFDDETVSLASLELSVGYKF